HSSPARGHGRSSCPRDTARSHSHIRTGKCYRTRLVNNVKPSRNIESIRQKDRKINRNFDVNKRRRSETPLSRFCALCLLKINRAVPRGSAGSFYLLPALPCSTCYRITGCPCPESRAL